MKLFNYTWNQHFQFGYAKPSLPQVDENVRWLSKRKNPDELFIAKYGRCEIEIPTWREANREAASRILIESHTHGFRPLVLYSGGLDSEIMLLSFLEARKELAEYKDFEPHFPIEIATLRLNSDYNRHDVEYVDKFRHRLADLGFSDAGLQFHQRELDVISYWKTDEFLSLARKTQIVSPIILCHLWLCEKMLAEKPDYLPIIGQGEIHLVKSTPPGYQAGISPYLPSQWSIVETENLCGLYRYFIEYNLPAIPGFFQFLPEQFEAQLRTNSVMQELIATQRVGKLGTRSSKGEILAIDYPELEPRPKFHGFEKIEQAHDVLRQQLGQKMPECESQWHLDVFQLYRDLRPLAKKPLQKDDWWAALSVPGLEIKNRRVNAQDVYATKFKTERGLRSAWEDARLSVLADAGNDFFQTLSKWLADHADAVLFDDGSLLARLFKATSTARKTVDARVIPRITGAEVCRDFLLTDLGHDPDLYLQFKACDLFLQSSLNAILLPRFSPRLQCEKVFLSGDSWIWVESEKEARLLASLKPHCHERLLTPWTNERLVYSSVRLLRTLHEAEISWSNYLAEKVLFFESRQDPTSESEVAKSRYQAVRNRTVGIMRQVPYSGLPYMNASTVLKIGETSLAGEPALGCGLLELRRILSHPGKEESTLNLEGLIEIPLSEWLTRATLGTPDFRLGGNFAYRQTIHGENLLSSYSRIAVALKKAGTLVCSALLQVVDPNCDESRGRLRIRCITTTPGFEKQGFARELIKKIVCASEASVAADFSCIEVWSAPQVVSIFLSAGFRPASDIHQRVELVHDIEQDRLVETDRVLQPLRRPLHQIHQPGS